MHVLQKILALPKKILIGVGVILIIIILIVWNRVSSAQKQPQYQTAQVTRGTLVASVAESGQVAIANRVEITTQASGVINHVYVKDGDTVQAGQTIADMTLDTDGAQRSSQAWASYLSAKNAVANANAQLYALQATMFTNWQNYLNLATNGTYQNGDGTPNVQNRQAAQFISSQDTWLNGQAQYQNQQGVVAQAQAALNTAWLSYQSSSATIAAPSTGVITDIVITPGLQITTSTSNNGTTISSQPVASIKTSGAPIISVNLSEIDAAKVQAGQKATVTFDAFPNQTFTGKVSGVDTAGVVSSGVTTYPTTIVLDLPNDKILPNMSATANIITDIKDNVLTVPTTAIQTTNGQSTVRVLNNGQITTVPVTTGIASDTDTEVTSGLSEGQTVVVGFVSTGTTATGTSPFSGGLRFGGGGGGGAVFINGGGARGGGGGGAGR